MIIMGEEYKNTVARLLVIVPISLTRPGFPGFPTTRPYNQPIKPADRIIPATHN